MPERSSKRKKSDHDFAVNAFRVVQEATGEAETADNQQDEQTSPPPADEGKNPNAVALGRLGGKKGGAARAAKLSDERKREIAKKAADLDPVEALRAE